MLKAFRPTHGTLYLARQFLLHRLKFQCTCSNIPLRKSPKNEVVVRELEFVLRLVSILVTDFKIDNIARAISTERLEQS